MLKNIKHNIKIPQNLIKDRNINDHRDCLFEDNMRMKTRS